MVETMEKVCIRLWWCVARVMLYAHRALWAVLAPFERIQRRAQWQHAAELFEMQGSPDKAISYYQKVLLKRPKDIKIYLALGRCYLRCFNLKEAARHVARVLEKESDHQEATFYTGVISFYQKDKAQAKAYLEQVVRRQMLDHKKHSMALEYLGEIALEEGAYGEAIERLEKAFMVHPVMGKSERRWVLMAEAHHMRGEDAKAIEYLRKAIEQNPSSAHAWNDLGVLLWGHGKRDRAVQCFETALRIEPQYMDAKNNLVAVKDARHYAN